MEKNEVWDINTQFVVKRNELIRHMKVGGKPYTPRELKMLNYMISKIQPDSKGTDRFKISIEGFIKACGLHWDSDNLTNNIEYMRRVISEIQSRNWWVNDPVKRNSGSLLQWIHSVKHDEEMVYFNFDDRTFPYLFALQKSNNYTQYQLVSSLRMEGKHSIRLYELLLSYFFANEETKTQEFLVDTFRELMDLGDNYERFPDLKRRVIEPSIEEINKYANNMRVSWRITKKARGNKTVKIAFDMRRLTDDEELESYRMLDETVNERS